MNCEWIKTEDNKYQCKLCGKRVPTPGKMNCPTKKDVPNIVQRGVNFVKATYNHIVTRGNCCNEEQKIERYNICKSNRCGLFRQYNEDVGICAHDDCGCFLRSNGKFLDKIAWADSKCPEGYWGPLEVKSQENDENGV